MPGASSSLLFAFSKNMKSMRKTAPKRVALTLMSKSMGNVKLKLSASVNASLTRPDHCLVTIPTSLSPSALSTLNSTSDPKQLQVQIGPSIFKTALPLSSLMV